jgi:hypothetical protein
MTTDEARAFVAKVQFTYAKSVPDNPHFYLVRAKLEPELQPGFDALVALIEREGYRSRFRTPATSTSNWATAGATGRAGRCSSRAGTSTGPRSSSPTSARRFPD